MAHGAPLCTKCALFEERIASEADVEYAVAESFRSLSATAAAGCCLCAHIRQRLLYGTPTEHGTLRDSNLPIIVSARLDYILINSPVQGDGAVELWPRPDLFLEGLTDYQDGERIEADAEEDIQKQPSRIYSLQNVEGLDALASMTRDWVSRCLKNHETCQLPFSGAKRSVCTDRVIPNLPTRLIDVGTGLGPPDPKLFIPDAALRHADYFALSYSWGKGMFPARMTATNIGKMQQRIDMDSLPKTVQDAIVFTKRVGLTRYLWVDALCIVQTKEQDTPGDDAAHISDWIQESQKFGEYYHNALCTLAATGTSCSKQGLFLDRPGLDFPIRPCRLHRYNPSGLPRTMVIEDVPPSWWDMIQIGPLFFRGWTMQERAMSMRMVHFARDAVLWECNEIKASEFSPQGLHDDDQYTLDLGEDLMNLRALLQGVQKDEYVQGWYDFATKYSMCQFTFFSDRMSALSGLAHRMQDLTGERYIAGLWGPTLHSGLAWINMQRREETDLPTTDFIAPTWSWASLPFAGNVRFLYCYHLRNTSIEDELHANWQFPLEVLNVQIHSSRPDDTGPIEWGRIRARGSVLHIEMTEVTLAWRTSPNYQGHPNSLGFSRKGLDPSKPIGGLYLDTLLPDDAAALCTITCLLVADDVEEETQEDEMDQADAQRRELKAAAIVLRPTGKNQDGIVEYTRIGLLIIPQWYLSGSHEQVTVDLV
ncbi:hypothetical protein BKA66DRAFT_436547 [Pyrenochaeta sp. MPI-SDFR-AT-0127]|nr:hypothetical protein BKA66DRAFT_436547 [Pyrenochaeta sp. MPI-SDFR-AT-0127]